TSLINVYRARSMGEMEALLNRVLTQNMGLSWVRIMFSGQSNLSLIENLSAGLSVFRVPLTGPPFRGGSSNNSNENLGELIFAKPAKSAFLKADKNFLTQIAEAVLLAIGRLAKLEQSETLKRQWEATFDAISVPLCLTDERLTVIKTNLAY